ncbi:MAG: VOC family protein [Planctomycetes bacterium]|nr:VOC family protein [Planctomycetota bacterium]
MSLAVKDLAASRAFYEQLGFAATGGDGRSWQVLRQGDTVIGLFQGMFERNTLTFNPGWSQQATPLPAFTDVRELQAQAQARGLTPTLAADPASTGPAFFVLTDPDGNPVLFDQHVGKPAAK